MEGVSWNLKQKNRACNWLPFLPTLFLVIDTAVRRLCLSRPTNFLWWIHGSWISARSKAFFAKNNWLKAALLGWWLTWRTLFTVLDCLEDNTRVPELCGVLSWPFFCRSFYRGGIDEVPLRRLPALDLTFGLAIEPKTSPVSGFPVFLFIIIMFSLFAIRPNPWFHPIQEVLPLRFPSLDRGEINPLYPQVTH